MTSRTYGFLGTVTNGDSAVAWSALGSGLYNCQTNNSYSQDLAFSLVDDSAIPTTATISSVTCQYSVSTDMITTATLRAYIANAGSYSYGTIFQEGVIYPTFATKSGTFANPVGGGSWTKALLFSHRYGIFSGTNPDESNLHYWNAPVGGASVNFTLAAPTATTNIATNTTVSGGQLNGTLNPSGGTATYPASYKFEWGLTTAYGNETTLVGGQTGSVDLNVSATLTGLSGMTTYHYRLVVTNADNTVNGADQSFTTGTGQPLLMVF